MGNYFRLQKKRDLAPTSDKILSENGFSFDFLALCDASRVVRQLRNWVRFSDKKDLTNYLKTISKSAMELRWLWNYRDYWDLARLLIPREIGGNEYIDVHGDAKCDLPELPPQRVYPEKKKRTMFRDTLKAVYFDGQTPDSHVIPTKFHRSCSDNVGFDILPGAKGLPLRTSLDKRRRPWLRAFQRSLQAAFRL